MPITGIDQNNYSLPPFGYERRNLFLNTLGSVIAIAFFSNHGKSIKGEFDPKSLPFFEITEVPGVVNASAVGLRRAEIAPNKARLDPKDGDVPHENKIGLSTEFFIAEPGVRTLNHLGEKDGKWDVNQYNLDLEQLRVGAAYELTPDKQHVFTTGLPEVFGPEEGGYSMYCGKYMQLEFGLGGDKLKLVGVKLGLKPNQPENHGWIVIIKGLNNDERTPKDRNLSVVVRNYEPGWTTATRLPPGQYVSEKYVLQQVAAAQKANCGTDGCKIISMLCIDAETGAYTLIQTVAASNLDKSEGWWQIKTNFY